MAIVKKQIKFDLTINDVQIKTLDDLKNNITTDIFGLYYDGRLLKWLGNIGRDDLATHVSELMASKLPEDKKLIELIQVVINPEDSEVQLNIGLKFYSEDPFNLYGEQAMYWITESAAQGNSDAQALLGFIYSQVKGDILEIKKSLYWYKKAADQGNVDALYNLGIIYYNGQGVSRDFGIAHNYFKKASFQGHSESKQYLNLMSAWYSEDKSKINWVYYGSDILSNGSSVTLATLESTSIFSKLFKKYLIK